MSEKGKKNKKKTGLGLAIWILAFLVILIIFLVKQEEIKGNFEKSGASALIEKKIGKDVFEKKDSPKSEESGETIIDLTKNLKKSEPIAKSEPKKSESVKKNESRIVDSQKGNADSSANNAKSEEKKTEVTLKTAEKSENLTTQQNQSQQSQNQKSQNQQTNSQSQNSSQSVTQNSAQSQNVSKTNQQMQSQSTQTAIAQKTEPTPVPVSNTIKAKICFVAIDSDGPVVRKKVTRSVAKDSPMGDALTFLLAGPSTNEAKTGCRSLIPAGTRLLGATVKNGVATLNFSEEFQFNQFGAEGSLAQLMQVVYTATEFPTVNSVQILIEGQKRDYLTEGVWIGSPLSKNSF